MKHLSFILALLAGCFVSTAAMAQTYVGITGGATHFNYDCDNASTCEKTAFGLKVYGGYKFTPNIAIEGAYADLGKFKITVNNSPGITLSDSSKLSALSLGGAFFYELAPNITALGRLGLASGKFKANALSETKINPYIGIGIGYSMSPGLSLNGTLDMNRFKFDGETKNTFMLGAGVSYGF
jgi:OmpA-OmpF porin, OOP family